MMFYKNCILTIMGLLISFSVLAAEENGNTLIPTEIIQRYFDLYSPAEKEKIAMDYGNVLELCLSQAKKGQRQLIYVATAGGIGSSKSKILESYLYQHPGFVYVDPDQRGLRFMINTYAQQINNYLVSESLTFQDLKYAYTKWREASNYIAYRILNVAYAKNLAIAHGTTSSGKNVNIEQVYKNLKKNRYKIILLLCSSTEENRLKAIEYREKHRYFVQSTREDLIKKAEKFYDNFPIYFKFADEIQFYWIEDFSKGWMKVGNYTRSAGLKWSHGDARKFIASYELHRKNHGCDLPPFDALVKNL